MTSATSSCSRISQLNVTFTKCVHPGHGRRHATATASRMSTGSTSASGDASLAEFLHDTVKGFAVNFETGDISCATHVVACRLVDDVVNVSVIPVDGDAQCTGVQRRLPYRRVCMAVMNARYLHAPQRSLISQVQ